MKRILHTIPAAFVIMAFLLGTIVALLPEPVNAMSGSGTLDDPYVIYDVYDLQDMANNSPYADDAYYELGGDIDATPTTTWNWDAGRWVYQGFLPRAFEGHFDGNNFTIYGLYEDYYSTSNLGVGLFASLGTSSVVQNVFILNAYVKGYADGNTYSCSAGVLVGYISGGGASPPVIENVAVSGEATAICRDTSSVGGHQSANAGGLIGGIDWYVTVSKCAAHVSVTATALMEAWANAGGLCGRTYQASAFSDCYARGNVTATYDSYPSCSAGGLIGHRNIGGTVDNCYSTGYVASGDDAGGLIGKKVGSPLPACTDSFWDIQTSGQATSDGGTGKNTTEMKTESTFTDVGWDFCTIWGIDGVQNDGYPFLRQLSLSRLIIKYAPVLYMREGELFFPREISSMLNESDLKNGETISGPITTGNLSAHNSDDYYLDLWEATPDYGCSGFPPSDCSRVVPNSTRFVGYNITVYGRKCEEPDYPDYIALQYWFFYVYNSWEREYDGELYIGNHHEGDWEMVTIVLDKETETPLWLTCARHHAGGKYDWQDEVELVGGTHPKVFVGQGSHASYATLGPEGVQFPLENIFPDLHYEAFSWLVDVTSGNGTALYPDGMDSSEIVGVNETEPYELADISDVPSWAEWKGAWGEILPCSDNDTEPCLGAAPSMGPAGLETPHGAGGNKWYNPVAWSMDPGSLDLSICIAGSPVDLHAYDSYGNHVGLNETGGMEAEIPGTYLYLPSAEDKELMWIYTGEYLRFEIEATDAGDFDFAIGRHIGSSNETEILVAYEDVPITENTTATVELSPENPDFVMEVDLDGDGTVDEYQEPDKIVVTVGQNEAPVADANGPYTGVAGMPVTLNGSGSSDSDGSIVSYEWDLDDDGEFDDATGEVVEYTWAEAYSGNVRLRVTDDGGATAITTTTAAITEATTLELLPETDNNPVDTTHNLTATVYDQFGYEMEGVAVTWSISGVGSFSGTPESQTDVDGEVDAVITSTELGTSTVRCEVTGNPSVYDTATKDWTYLEDFEWGNDGDSLGTDGGNIDWTVETDGSSVAQIDTTQAHTGTRSGRFYYDGSSENILAYYSQDSPTWRGFYLRKDKDAVPYTITGDGTNTVFIRVKQGQWLQYYDGSWHNVCKISANTWHFIEFRNIDWTAATYDIYVDDHLENSDTPMSASTSYNGVTAYYGSSRPLPSEFWIDDILK